MSATAEMRQQRWVEGGGAAALLLIAFPLWAEFSVRGALAWNVFLAIFLTGLVVAALLLQRYFSQHAGQIGEARFDTRNKSDLNG